MSILEKTPAFVLMIISLTGFLSGEMIKCGYSRNMTESHDGVYRYTACVSLICCLFVWGISGFNLNVSLYTVGMALLFGIAVMGQITASAFAMKIGPWAYTAVMMSLSTVIPALSGVIFWDEELGLNKIIGILLMLVCFILSVKTDKEDTEKKKRNIKWLILSVIASLCTGGIGILQKAHQSSVYKNELVMFLVISFSFSAVYSFIMMCIMGSKNTNRKTVNKKALIFFISFINILRFSVCNIIKRYAVFFVVRLNFI
jgi:drug/metabolite transporter (DMT)-like permease